MSSLIGFDVSFSLFYAENYIFKYFDNVCGFGLILIIFRLNFIKKFKICPNFTLQLTL
jgi:hypothetical protein